MSELECLRSFRRGREEDEKEEANKRKRLNEADWTVMVATLKNSPVEVLGALGSVIHCDDLDGSMFVKGSRLETLLVGRYALEQSTTPQQVVDAYVTYFWDKPPEFFNYACDPLLDFIQEARQRVPHDPHEVGMFGKGAVYLTENEFIHTDIRLMDKWVRSPEKARPVLQFLQAREFQLGEDDAPFDMPTWYISLMQRIYYTAIYISCRWAIESATTIDEMKTKRAKYAKRLYKVELRNQPLLFALRPTIMSPLRALVNASKTEYGEDQVEAMRLLDQRNPSILDDLKSFEGVAQVALFASAPVMQYLMERNMSDHDGVRERLVIYAFTKATKPPNAELLLQWGVWTQEAKDRVLLHLLQHRPFYEIHGQRMLELGARLPNIAKLVENGQFGHVHEDVNRWLWESAEKMPSAMPSLSEQGADNI